MESPFDYQGISRAAGGYQEACRWLGIVYRVLVALGSLYSSSGVLVKYPKNGKNEFNLGIKNGRQNRRQIRQNYEVKQPNQQHKRKQNIAYI